METVMPLSFAGFGLRADSGSQPRRALFIRTLGLQEIVSKLSRKERRKSSQQEIVLKSSKKRKKKSSLPPAVMTHILEEDLQSMLEQMLQLSLDSPQDSEPSDQIAAAAPPLVATPGPDAADNSLGNPSVEWAEMLVGEMARAATVDDARSLAVRILEAFGDSVIGSRAAKVIGDKDRVLGAALQQNTILKRAVIVQHRRHLEGEEKTKELHGMVAEYREKVRQLEISNYALSMHLRNAGSGSSMPGPGNYNPKVF